MIQLKTELEAYGCKMERSAFRELLADVFAEMFPGMTDEDLLCDEFGPQRFVKAIRERASARDLPHSLILKALLNVRKCPN